MARVEVIYLIIAVTIVHFLLIHMFLIVPNFDEPQKKLPSPPITRMKWNTLNINKLRTKLNSTLYGQDEAVNKFLILLSKNYRYKKHSLIFFLGGPGVGKQHIFNKIEETVKNSTECSNNSCQFYVRHLDMNFSFPTGTFCDSLHHRGVSIAITADHINNFKQIINDEDNKNMGTFYNNDHQCLKNLNLNFVHIITGSIINDDNLASFKNTTEYINYLDKYSEKLKIYMKKHAPKLQYDIIIFKPLNLLQVLKNCPEVNENLFIDYSYRQGRWDVYKKYTSKDFVPHGTNLKNKVYEIYQSRNDWITFDIDN